MTGVSALFFIFQPYSHYHDFGEPYFFLVTISFHVLLLQCTFWSCPLSELNLATLFECHFNTLNCVSGYRTLADALADALDELRDDFIESDCSSIVSDVDE